MTFFSYACATGKLSWTLELWWLKVWTYWCISYSICYYNVIGIWFIVTETYVHVVMQLRRTDGTNTSGMIHVVLRGKIKAIKNVVFVVWCGPPCHNGQNWKQTLLSLVGCYALVVNVPSIDNCLGKLSHRNLNDDGLQFFLCALDRIISHRFGVTSTEGDNGGGNDEKTSRRTDGNATWGFGQNH